MASNQPEAVKKAKKKLGMKVKKQYLNHFDAWRVSKPSRALPKGSIVVKHSLIKRVGR